MNFYVFRRSFQYLILVLLMVFLSLFMLLPVWTVIETGCNWGLIGEVFQNRIYLEGLLNSFSIAIVTTLLVFVMSLALAIIYDKYEFTGKEYCNLLMLAPMILPPFVGALGFQQILGHYGVLNAVLGHFGIAPIDFLSGKGIFWSVCVIEALHLYPIFYLNLVTALGNIDPALDEAGANLGASKLRRFFKIKLPLLRSGILAGGSLVLVWSFTELGTPLMFGYNRTTSVQILNGLMELETNPIPYTLVLIMLVFSALMYTVVRWLLGGNDISSNKGSISSGAIKLLGFKKFLPIIPFLAITFAAVLPHIALVLTAFSKRYYNTILPQNFTLEHFQSALSNPLVLPSITNSLKYSILACIIATLCGVMAAFCSTRWKLKGGRLGDLLAMLPLAVPGVVVAFGFLSMSVKYAWAREIFNPIENPLWLLATAYAVRRIPYVLRSVASGLEQTPEELENAARNFGASPLRVMIKITLPLVVANLLVGGLFAFSFSMLEVSDSLILAQKAQFFPITRALFELSQILGSGPATACAFGVWAMIFLATTLAAAGIILGRKIGSIFRF